MDEISQAALESIGMEDYEYQDNLDSARAATFRGQAVRSIKTVRVEPGIQGRPLPVITGRIDGERVWWDTQSMKWVRKPTYINDR